MSISPLKQHAKPRKISWRTRFRLNRALNHNGILTAENTYIFDELTQGDIAIDCGANVGLITELMAVRGARTHAFEPDPHAFGILSGKFLGRENVICHNAAVSNRPGKMKLYFRKEHRDDPVKFSVGSTLNAGKNDIDRRLFTDVEVISLAEFIMQFPRVRILKLDIEGTEVDVLEDLLDRQLFNRIDLTLVETHEEWIPDLIPRLQGIKRRLNQQKVKNVYLNWI